jgi:acyl-coenzyme A synthetase/AMP-(fatty) acid ligase
MTDGPVPPRSRVVRGTLAASVLRHALAEPDAIAVRNERTVVTRAGLVDRASRLAERLDDGTSRPVLVTSHDGIDLATTLVAANALGRPIVVAGWAVSVDDRRAVVRETAASAVVGAPADALDGLALVDPYTVGAEVAASDTPTALAAPRLRLAERGDAPVPDGSGPCAIVTTSGSTGRPRACLVTDDGVVREAATPVMRPEGPWPGDRFAMPTAGSTAIVLAVGRALAEGVSMTLLDPLRIAPSAFVRHLAEHGITALRMPASLLRRLARSIGPGVALPDLRSVSVYGEALLWSDVAQVRASLSPECTVTTSYGITEGGRVTVRTVRPGDAIGEGPVGVGAPIPGRRVWIDAGDGRPAPLGVEGAIVVEGRLHRHGAGIEQLPDGEARARPGDVGRLEADGTLTLLGREDRMVKIAAVRVEPDLVEDVLLGVPGVLDAAAVAVEVAPSELRLVAHVVVDAARSPSASDLLAVLRTRVPAPAVPARIALRTGPLPTLASGKVDRSRLIAES